MQKYVVTSLSDFLNKLYTFPEVDYFRGQSSVAYKLIPSIGRIFKMGEEKALLNYEKEIFEDFKRKYLLFTDVRPKNDKEFLFLAQHYGLRTRLLDWTFNPIVALYFACCSNFDKNGIVFQAFPFSHHCFNENTDNILSFPYFTPLLSNITDIRYKNQNGLFILYPQPWKDNFDHISNTFEIPAICKMGILNQLMKIGFSKAFILPSMDSLTEDIMYNYNLRYNSYMKNEIQIHL